MAGESAPRVFISYSREDSELTETLAANLIAQGFAPWVDRQRIEGGDDWEAVIRRAIQESIGFILVLTPNALKSQWVRSEFRRAQELKKNILPLLYKPVDYRDAPLGWDVPQHIDMRGDDSAALQQVARMLRRGMHGVPRSAAASGDSARAGAPDGKPPQRGGLLGWLRPKARTSKLESLLSPEDVGRLYREVATLLERRPRTSDDLAKAINLLEDIVADNPNALNGRAKSKLKALQPELGAARMRDLEQHIEQARLAGDWRQESALWNTLATFRKLTQAESKRMQLAQRNQAYQDGYNLIVRMVGDGSYSGAANDLRKLWQDAPDYGDPAGLARTLRAHGIAITSPAEAAAEREKQARLEAARAAATLAAASATQSAAAAAAALERVREAVAESERAANQLTTPKAQPKAQQTARNAPAALDTVTSAAKAAVAQKDAAIRAASDAHAAATPEQAETASSLAEAAASAAAAASGRAERITWSFEREIAYNQRLSDWERRKARYEREMRTVSGFVRHIFDGSMFGIWAAAACFIVGGTAIVTVTTRALLPAEIAAGALAILCYAAYRRVVYWPAYLLIAVLAAMGATLLAPIAADLAALPIQHMSAVGIGPLQVPLARDTTLINANAATWALLCGPLGLLVGLGGGAAYISEKADGKADEDSAGCGMWIMATLFAAALGIAAGIGVGLLLGALIALPVVGLGWLSGGLILGAVAGLIASASLASSDWTMGEKVGTSVGVLIPIALVLGFLLVAITGQSVASVLIWGAGVLAGGATAAGLVLLIAIANEARRPHPFPEPEPTM